MSRVIRLGLVVLAGMAFATLGCGSSESKDTTVTPDVPADVVPEVVTELPMQEVPGDDVAQDTATGDTAEVIDWDALPRLPADKTFTKDFAAGVGRGDISPTQPTHLGGFGFCMGDENACRSTTGVHDPLYSSAVAIADPASKEVVIFVGTDTSGMVRTDIEDLHQRIQTALYQEFGVFFPGERAMIGATHAHSACDTVGLWGPGFGAGRQEQYIALLKDGIVKSARDAYASLQDVTLDWGKSTYPNYDDDGIVHDDEIYVLRGKKAGGDTLFTLVRGDGHPTTYGSDMLAASADYPGTMRKKLEDELGGMNIFMNGPIGSVYIERPSECGLTEEAFPEGDRCEGVGAGSYMKVTCTGYAVAEKVKEALAAATPVATTGISFKHTRFEFHPTNEALMMLCEYGPLPYDWVDVTDPESRMYSIFSLARVGDLNFLTNPGESFPSFSEEAKKILTDEAGLTNPITLGLTQDWMGYLLLEKQWHEPFASKLSYHMSLSPGDEVEPTFMAALRVMLGLPVPAAE